MLNDEQAGCLERVHAHANALLREDAYLMRTLPDASKIQEAESRLLTDLPERGTGIERMTGHLIEDVTPGLNASSLSTNYYGFVTVALYDQNPQVHLPDQTVASTVEDRALRLLMQLLRFEPATWSGVFTTGATASNVHGLLLGREYVIIQALRRRFSGLDPAVNVGAHGLIAACRAAGLESVDVYTTMPHSSLLKAASVAGIGRCNVHDVASCKENILFDMESLADLLEKRRDKSAAIIVISCGEVNTGMFATDGYESVLALRSLCDWYGAWLHVDGAFGVFARVLHGLPEFEDVSRGAQGLGLADSIAGDGHKLLNVPYDCGFFLCRHRGLAQEVFQNANAAYLNTGTDPGESIPSPLNLGIENSRRFRGLPVYATLMAYGRKGYQAMLVRQVRFARAVALYLHNHKDFELLPNSRQRGKDEIFRKTFIIVLFRAKEEALNAELVSRINNKAQVYISGTFWNSRPASRIAAANWQVKTERDLGVVQDVLTTVVIQWSVVQHVR
ncbi:MAG: hypothetical protein Q9217_001067 [Psora testacea]